jgi:DNA-binding transcriptional ArsR family regulator
MAETSTDPFAALGDGTRRQILQRLAVAPCSVREIADELPVSRPAVSRHLRLLKEAGLVEESASGTRRIYRLREQGLDAVRAYLEQVWGEAAARFRLVAENTDDPHDPHDVGGADHRQARR